MCSPYRHRSAQLLDSIEQKDEARAVSIIEDNRKAAWLRSESSGNYPIHEAINQVSTSCRCRPFVDHHKGSTVVFKYCSIAHQVLSAV